MTNTVAISETFTMPKNGPTTGPTTGSTTGRDLSLGKCLPIVVVLACGGQEEMWPSLLRATRSACYLPGSPPRWGYPGGG